MEELGDISGRFNYEFACCINKRVPRLYISGQEPVRWTCLNEDPTVVSGDWASEKVKNKKNHGIHTRELGRIISEQKKIGV